MADIKLTTADTAGFIPQYWANRALDVLRNQIVLANLVAKDVNFGEVGWKGKSITVPYPGTFSAVDKVADTAVTPQVPVGGTSVTLTLNKHKVVPFLVEDFAAAQANMSLMDRYVEPAVIAVAEQFETDLWTTMAAAGATVPNGVQGTGLVGLNVRQAMKLLNDAKAPAPDRSLVVSTSDQISILGDTTLQSFFAFSQPQRVINGFMGKLYGLDTYWSQLIPKGQTVTVGAASAGTFTLTIGGQTTASLAFNASPATVQAAVQGLSSVGAGLASVSGPSGGLTWSIALLGSAAGQAITGTGTGLTGGAFAAGTAGTNKNVAFHKNAIMYAVRPFPETPGNVGILSAQASDPETGLSIRISTQYDINNIGQRVNLDILYGAVVLRPTQAVLLDS